MIRTPDPVPEVPDRLADERIVHALLLHLADPHAAVDRDSRVQRAIAALNGQAAKPAASRAPRPAWRKPTVLALAAFLLVAISLLTLLVPPRSASASFEEVLASLDAGDRTYLLRVVPPIDPDSTHPSLDGATLYLRSGGPFLLVRTAPSGNDIFDGFDGHASWRLRRGVLADAAQNPGPPLPRVMGEIPISDLRHTLAQLQPVYTISSATEPDPASGRRLLHFTAVRRSLAAKAPPLIEIWADPQTRIPLRILFDRAKFQGSPSPRRLTLTLTSDAPLPANWFAAAGHAPPP